MKNRLIHISPLLIIGFICLLFADAIYVKSLKTGHSSKYVIPYAQNASNQSFFTYVVENSFGY
jgi:hypothetical protein